jgi:biotin transport system ATP-binding protein
LDKLFSIRGLGKIFPNGHKALDKIDLDIHEGRCLITAGANGSGKTVLMRIIACLMDQTEGSVLYRGQDTASDTVRKALRRELGIVFQDPDTQFVGETVEEDIAFGPGNLGFKGAALEKQVDAALEKTGLEAKRRYSLRRLSGGEKRRLAIAGALAMECKTLILDEPFANLDWPGVVQVLTVIKELKAEGKTLIILTHELEKVLAYADTLVILDHGIKRDEGNPEDVLSRLNDEYGVRDPRHAYNSIGECTWLPH